MTNWSQSPKKTHAVSFDLEHAPEWIAQGMLALARHTPLLFSYCTFSKIHQRVGHAGTRTNTDILFAEDFDPATYGAQATTALTIYCSDGSSPVALTNGTGDVVQLCEAIARVFVWAWFVYPVFMPYVCNYCMCCPWMFPPNICEAFTSVPLCLPMTYSLPINRLAIHCHPFIIHNLSSFIHIWQTHHLSHPDTQLASLAVVPAHTQIPVAVPCCLWVCATGRLVITHPRGSEDVARFLVFSTSDLMRRGGGLRVSDFLHVTVRQATC